MTEKDNGKRKKRIVGTAEYISPEMIEDETCSYAADLWALGCIIYQFFHGQTPFYEINDYLIINKIKNRQMNPISIDIPEEAKDLIIKLLSYEPINRLGYKPKFEKNYNLKEIKDHPFFKGINFDTLDQQEPPLKSNYYSTSPSSSSNRSSLDYSYCTSEIECEAFDFDNLYIDMNYFSYETQLLKKNITYPISKSKLLEKSNSLTEIIFQEIVKKKSPWYHYNTRKLILYLNRLEYLEPRLNIKKGEILLNKSCSARVKDENKFEVFTPKRTFLFKLDNKGSKDWSNRINLVIGEL